MFEFRSAAARLRCSVSGFAASDRGSATVWNLTWLAGFAVMAGLAIDSTNAWRVKTMLASTADVAALAGAWDLPENYLKRPYVSGGYPEVETSALDYAGRNMAWNEHGSYMQPDDIQVGHWDPASRRFTPGEQFAAPDALSVNAVRVDLGRNYENENNLQTSLLRMVGVGEWEINTTATAMYGVNSCYMNGIISRETLFLRANAEVLSRVCLHGQLGVNIRPNGQWANPAALSTGYSPHDVVGNWAVGNHQTLLSSGEPVDMSTPRQTNLYPPMVDQIGAMGYSMLAGYEHYRHFVYPTLDAASTAPPEVILLPKNFSTVTGTTPVMPLSSIEKWWRGEDVIQVASLGGFENLGGLLGLAAAGGNGNGGGSTTNNGSANGGTTTTGNGNGGGSTTGNGNGGTTTAGNGNGGGSTTGNGGGSTGNGNGNGGTTTAGNGSGGNGGNGGGGTGTSGWTPDYHDTYTYLDASHKGNSNQFTWPAQTGNLVLSPQQAFNTTTTGAPTVNSAPLTEQRIYFADQCQGGKLTLSGTVRNVTIVTNCKIDITGGAKIENAVLLTTDTSQQAVQISNGARIGAITACEGWGGVRIYSNGDIRAPSNGNMADSQFWGAQLVARDTIHFAAQSDSSKGISMLAGGTIDLAAQARIGALDASQMPPNPLSGCPEDGVGLEFDRYAYEPALVE